MLPADRLLLRINLRWLAHYNLLTGRIHVVLRVQGLLTAPRLLALPFNSLLAIARHVGRLYILLAARYCTATDGKPILNLAIVALGNCSVAATLTSHHLTFGPHLMTRYNAYVADRLVVTSPLRLISATVRAVGPLCHILTQICLVNLAVFEALWRPIRRHLSVILYAEAVLVGAVTASSYLLAADVERVRIEMIRSALLLLFLLALHSAHGLHLILTAENVAVAF